jgi:hypothetical protein
MVFSFNQAIEKISSLDNDYDCVFVQVLTNHLRESSPKECAQHCTKLRKYHNFINQTIIYEISSFNVSNMGILHNQNFPAFFGALLLDGII